MKRFKIKGIEKVMGNLNKKASSIKKKLTTTGFIRVSIFFQEQTEKTSPITPLDTGNLRSSYFTTIKDADGSVINKSSGFSPDNRVTARHKQNQNATVSTMQSVVGASTIPFMIFGFSANYAMAVHEKTGKDINWGRPSSGPNFFLNHVKNNQSKILKILRQNAKV